MTRPAAVSLVVAAAATIASCATSPPRWESPRLHAEIRSAPACALGSAPRVTVSIVNATDEEIVLVGSLDGSDLGRRFPHCVFEVTGPDGASSVVIPPHCGNMNALREADFVVVPPRGAFDPYAPIDDYDFFAACQLEPPSFPKRGRYRIRFTYSTESDDLDAWLGMPSPETAGELETLRSLLARVPKTRVVSDVIEVEIVDVSPR